MTDMNVLIVKTSSLGDVLHTLPAVSDAVNANSNVHFDWVVEENFAEIPAWHPAVRTVIPVAMRRWRKHLMKTVFSGEWRRFRQQLKTIDYDVVIDAQGLIKSSIITRMAHGLRCGLDRNSARESLSAFAYQKRITVPGVQHAILRVRQLFAQVLGYTFDEQHLDYGIAGHFNHSKGSDRYVVFLHGTTWATKLWPDDYWIKLTRIVSDAGYSVHLPWGNIEEHTRAKAIATGCEQAVVLPAMSLAGLADELAGAARVVAADSGLGHLAAALGVPTVSIYGATNEQLTGTRGVNQAHLSAQFECSPCLSRVCTYSGSAEVHPACYSTVTPPDVWSEFDKMTDY